MARTRPLFVRHAADKTGQRIRVFFQDEARIGQQGTLSSVWAERGSRPTAIKQTEYEWCYVWAAVDPLTGDASMLVTPTVNTHYMNAHLRFISQMLSDDEHAVLVLDQAGWHVAKALQVPSNVTLLHLPGYSPQLNPIERLWAYLRSRYLSNRIMPITRRFSPPRPTPPIDSPPSSSNQSPAPRGWSARIKWKPYN